MEDSGKDSSIIDTRLQGDFADRALGMAFIGKDGYCV